MFANQPIMTKILTLFAVVLSMNVSAQLEVTELSSNTEELYSDAAGHVIRMHVNESDTAYVFLFRNAKYSKSRDLLPINFSDTEELVQFVDLMSTALQNGKEYQTKSYRITQGNIKKSLTVLTTQGHFYINAKWLKKMDEMFLEEGLKENKI